jgi:glycine/D-amino acid oxidase-like deaminating enzyme
VGVVGAGVIGLSVAAELARLGARVTVIDPAPLGDNASGVSAGMLAPALESAFDEPAGGRFPLLLHARDLWPGFAAAHGVAPPEPCGALWLTGDPEAASARLADEGARFQVLSAAEAASGPPGAAAPRAPSSRPKTGGWSRGRPGAAWRARRGAGRRVRASAGDPGAARSWALPERLDLRRGGAGGGFDSPPSSTPPPRACRADAR